MVRDNRHDTAYILSAICPDRGVATAAVTPAANTETMNLHLDEIGTQVAEGAHALLICGGAGWHRQGGDLAMPDNISLPPLPPDCPELNPLKTSGDIFAKTSSLHWSGKPMNKSSEHAQTHEVLHRRPGTDNLNQKKRLVNGQFLDMILLTPAVPEVFGSLF